MAVNPKQIIAPVQVANSATTYYTVPDLAVTVISKLTFTNTSAGNVSVTLYLVPSGGSVGDSTTLIKTRTLAPNETWVSPEAEGHILNAAGTIRSVASAATSITLIASGREIV